MSKQELVSAISQAADVTLETANKMLQCYHDTVASVLASGGKISIPGFGSWETSVRQARTGRNPQTGAAIQIAEATLPKFRPSKNLKEAVDQK